MDANNPRIVFKAEDETSYQVLESVVTALEPTADLKFLFLDRFINVGNDSRKVKLNKESVPFPAWDIADCLRTNYFDSVPRSLWKAVLQRLVVDTGPQQLFYNVEDTLRTSARASS